MILIHEKYLHKEFYMEQHLIVLDLDGTLLNDEKTIPPYTKDILNEVMRRGHQVMIATGRPYRASKVYYDELGLNTPIVNFNGAYVHHPKNEDFPVTHRVLDLGLSLEVIKSLHRHGVTNMIAEVKDHVYINSPDDRLFEGFSMGEPEIITGDLRENLKEAPTSLLVEAKEESISDIKDMLSHFYTEHIEHRRWGAPFPVIEIVAKGINKARGIMSVCDYLQIHQSHTIAFGDEDNDIEMIKYVRNGVATANALSELKDVSDDVTASNNDDGIGEYLNRYFNLNMPKTREQ